MSSLIQSTMDEWNNIVDALPAEPGPIWVWNGLEVRIALWRYSMTVFPEEAGITHWKAVTKPEPPRTLN